MDKFLNLGMYEDLIKNNLVRRSYNQDNTLVTLKYSKKVFYNNLWNKHPLLLESRGHTFDTRNGNLVSLPFKKIFNHLENGVGKDFGSKYDKRFIAVEKINGSMGCVSLHEGRFIFSTTGSCNSNTSEFVERLEKLFFYTVNDIEFVKHVLKNASMIFEVVCKEDPHIINESYGLYLIGVRDHYTGNLLPEGSLDIVAKKVGGVLRPSYYTSHTYEEFQNILDRTYGEGFIIQYSPNDDFLFGYIDTKISGLPQFKIKSSTYLAHKFLARVGSSNKKIYHLFGNDRNLKGEDEEIVAAINGLKKKYTADEFLSIPEQERLSILRKIKLEW